VIRAAQIQDLLYDLFGVLVGVVVVAAEPPTLQPLIARFSKSVSPEIEG